MKGLHIRLVILAVIAVCLYPPRGGSVLASGQHAATAKQACKTVAKKIHGKKRTVKICKLVKATPSPTASLPTGGTLVATIVLPGLNGRGEIQYGEGSVWVRRDDKIVRIDPSTNTVTATLTVPGQHYIGIGAGSVWTSDPNLNNVNRVDPSTGQVVATIPVGDLPEDFAFTPGAVWVSNHHSGTVSRIDPATNHVVATVTVGPAGRSGPESLAVGSGAVWVCVPNVGVVARIDPQSSKMLAKISIPGGCVDSPLMAADENGIWIPEPNQVVRIDPRTDKVVADIREDVVDAFGIAPGLQSIWVADRTQGVLRIDPQVNEVKARLPVPGAVNTVTTGAGSVWAESDDQVFRIQPR